MMFENSQIIIDLVTSLSFSLSLPLSLSLSLVRYYKPRTDDLWNLITACRI